MDVSQVPDAEPVEEPLSPYGNRNPYTVLGETYELVPTTAASTATRWRPWYGKKFHGMKTSSGEKYDMYKMTAAHANLVAAHLYSRNQQEQRQIGDRK